MNGSIPITSCYNCREMLIYNEPCHNPECKVSDAKSTGSEEAAGEHGSDSDGERLSQDRCPHCRRRSGDDEVHLSSRHGGDHTTLAYVPGVGTVSVQGRMSIYGKRLTITSHENVNVVSHRSR